MLLAVEDEGLAPLEIAEKYTRAVFEDAEAVGHPARPTSTPKATEHIPEMIAITETLVDEEHAYVVDSGSVYFDVTSFPELRQALRQHARQPPRRAPRPRDRSAQATRGRLRAVEGGGTRPAHEVAEPVGRGVPRVARRVLRDVHEVPRATASTSTRAATTCASPTTRTRSRSPRARSGTRSCRSGCTAATCVCRGRRSPSRRGTSSASPSSIERGLDPLAFRWLTFQTRYRSEMDFTWEAMEDADRAGHAAPPADGRAGRPRPPSSARPRRASTRGSARRSRPTSTSRRPW